MSTIPSPPNSGFHPASFQKNTDDEPSWNEGFFPQVGRPRKKDPQDTESVSAPATPSRLSSSA